MVAYQNGGHHRHGSEVQRINFSDSMRPPCSQLHITSGNGGERQQDDDIVIIIAATPEMNLLLAMTVMATTKVDISSFSDSGGEAKNDSVSDDGGQIVTCLPLSTCHQLLTLLSPTHVQIAGAGCRHANPIKAPGGLFQVIDFKMLYEARGSDGRKYRF